MLQAASHMAADQHRLDIRSRKASRVLQEKRLDISRKRRHANFSLHSAKECETLFGRVRIEQGNVFLGSALPLQVNRQQVGTAGEEKPNHFPAQLGIPHELCDLGKHTVAHATIARTRSVAELSISFFLCSLRAFMVSAWRFCTACAIKLCNCTLFKPAPSFASDSSLTSEPAGSGCFLSCARIKSSRSEYSGRGIEIEATPGCCTIPWFTSIWFSETRQIVTSAFRRSGLRAQRLRITNELRSSADMLEMSPAGTMVSAKSITSPIFLPSAIRRR